MARTKTVKVLRVSAPRTGTDITVSDAKPWSRERCESLVQVLFEHVPADEFDWYYLTEDRKKVWMATEKDSTLPDGFNTYCFEE